ncbi:hypothetical protein GQ42DRAFT_142582 [Ramicandelaber brevisporus]|nr:hypothetical protein GQ42DRAFT_142582 [Ramicandelaber brevisporus]
MTDSELSCLEQLWLKLFDGRDEKLVLSVILFTITEVAYVVPSLVNLLCNYISFFDCYKIQPPPLSASQLQQQQQQQLPTDTDEAVDPLLQDPSDVSDAVPAPNASVVWKCVKSFIIMSLLASIPLYLIAQPVLRMAGVQISTVPFPSFPTFAIQFLAITVINDTMAYWFHRLEHKWNAFYTRIHSVHHENYPLFGFTGLYQHPIEIALTSIISILGPILYSLTIGDLHVVTYVAILASQAFTAVRIHSGYDFPWDPLRYVPFLVQPVDHDNHHVVVEANYAGMFTLWDKMWGTYFEAPATPAAAAANDE